MPLHDRDDLGDGLIELPQSALQSETRLVDSVGVDQWQLRARHDLVDQSNVGMGVGDARAALQDASAVALCRERLCHVAPQVPTIRGCIPNACSLRN